MMIARGFRSVIWVGAVGGAALGCYMVSLRVATERAELAGVELRIVDAKREIRSLQTELGTRGRLNQLEEWNSNVLALSAPSSAQFVSDAYALAQLQTRQPNVGEQGGNVRMAAAETAGAAPAPSAAKPAPRPRVVHAIVTTPAPSHADASAPVRRASFEEDGSAGRIGAGDRPDPAAATDGEKRSRKLRRASLEEDGSAGRIGSGDRPDPGAAADGEKRPHKLRRASFEEDGSADRVGVGDPAQGARRPHKVRHAAVLAAAMGAPVSRQSRNGGGGAR
jgi:hypothetical protein